MVRVNKFTCAFLFLCTVLVFITPPQAVDAVITCGQVQSGLAPCLGYLQGRPISRSCCNGVRNVNRAARTTADRRTACTCLQSAARALGSSINFRNAAGLPRRCGVNIPFAISPRTDCSRIR